MFTNYIELFINLCYTYERMNILIIVAAQSTSLSATRVLHRRLVNVPLESLFVERYCLPN